MRLSIRLLIASLLSIFGVAAAHANEPIERSGLFFHQAVCARAIGPQTARCHAHVRVDARGNLFFGKAPNATPNVTPSGYGPADLRSAYVISGTGNGTIVAIVDAYGYPNAKADLAVYRAQYGLGACTTANGCFIKINQSGGTSFPPTNTGWDQEQALDLDMVSAICPGCRIMLVQASSAIYGNLAAAVNEAAAKGAKVISNSYGGGESGSSAYNSAYTHPGIAITASSGDSGYGASFPATSPGVIAVGGTSLTHASNARGWSETAWSGGGSGCSKTYAKPSWQTDTLCTMRMETDISADADPSTAVAVYGPTGGGFFGSSRSGWMVFGGTSVAAPLVGAIYGLTNASPNAAQKIWQVAPTGLNDVTSGSNGSCGGTYFCTAGAHYDGPTGNGTPAGTAAF
jgi:subtilase family serine protease